VSAAEVVQDLAGWRAEARRLFGPDPAAWRFTCPSCGHEAACGDFASLGADPARAAQECIGRVHLEQGRAALGPPCDWAAFGLLGTLGRGVQIEDGHGEPTDVFAFAGQEPSTTD
jgi:hypothetical protein